MSADEIKALQQRLTDAGCYKGAIDGAASGALDDAIKACPDQRPFLRIETGMHTALISRMASTPPAGCSRPCLTIRPFGSGPCPTASSSGSFACRSATARPAWSMRRRCRRTGAGSPPAGPTQPGTRRESIASRSSTSRTARSGASARSRTSSSDIAFSADGRRVAVGLWEQGCARARQRDRRGTARRSRLWRRRLWASPSRRTAVW